MILVILGAGTSYDSDPRRPSLTAEDVTRPPLTRDLFEGRFAALEDHPECYRLIPRLRAAAAREESIEGELEKVRDEARGRQPTLERALIALRAYIGDVIESAETSWASGHHGVTN